MPKLDQKTKEITVFAQVNPKASGFASAHKGCYRRTTSTGALHLRHASANAEDPALIPIDAFRCTDPEGWLSHAWPDGSPTPAEPLDDCSPVGGRIEALVLALLAKLGKPIDVREGVLCTNDGMATVLAPVGADWHLGDGYQIPADALSTAALGATQYEVAPAPTEGTDRVLTIEVGDLRCVTCAGCANDISKRENVEGLLAALGSDARAVSARGALKEVKNLVERAGGKWTRVARGDDLLSVEWGGANHDASELAQALTAHGKADATVVLLGEPGGYWMRAVSALGEGYQLITMVGPK